MTLQLVLLTVAVVMLGCVLCYKIGLRYGRKQGLALGQAETPLLLRERALSTGCCPSCGTQSWSRDIITSR